MAESTPRRRLFWRAPDRDRRRRLMRLLTIGVYGAVIGVVLLLNSLNRAGELSVAIGEVAQRDIIAPEAASFVSPILTANRQAAAVSAVEPVYFPPDPNVAREQILLQQEALAQIGAVRALGLPEPEAADRLLALNALTLSDEEIATLLAMDDDTWTAVSNESSAVLERVMREPIREADVGAIRDGLAMQVSARFNARNAGVAVALARDFIRPNREENTAATQAARDQALASVEPQERAFGRGQIVVQAGTRISALDYEALEQLGLLLADEVLSQLVAQAALTAALATTAATLYIARSHTPLLRRMPDLWLLEGLFLLGILLYAPFSGSETSSMLFPAAAIGLLMAGLAGAPLAVAATGLQALLMGFMSATPFETAAFVAFGGAVGVLMLRGADRLNRYFFVGLVIALVNAGVVGVFWLNGLSANPSGAATTTGLALLNGIVSAMTALVGLYAITLIFNVPTSIKLVELSQPNQPLLQRLLREAPGTYQHSLQVANLAEQAASAIGADADLVRVAALYHDVGKILNPAFFIENQADGRNPHDALNDPLRSAALIIGHVPDGDRLARQHRLPARLRDFIWEHHGTTRVSYFLSRALSLAADPALVDVEPFTYPGPRPQTRESAILMLADTSESTTRARKPANRQEIATIIHDVVESRIAEGQLDEAPLTLQDIDRVREIFVEMLQGVFHPRISYPGALAKLHTQELTLPADLAAAAPGAAAAIPLMEDDGPVSEVPTLKRGRTGESERAQTETAASGGTSQEQGDGLAG